MYAQFPAQNEFEEGGDLSGGTPDFDFDAADAEISEGLGFAPAPIEDKSEDVQLDDAPTEQEVLETEAAPSEETAPVDTGAPRTWRKEAQEAWATLPPTVQEEVLKREADMFKGIESYKQQASVGETFAQLVNPFMPSLQQAGVNPVEHVYNLLNAHHTLATGTPEAKSQFFRQIARDYGVDLESLYLEGDAQPYTDPQITALQQQLQQLQSAQQSEIMQRQQARHAEVSKTVESFAANPDNIYFNDVSEIMTKLINGGIASSLEDAYKQAIALHPEVSQKEAARQTALTAAKTKAAAEAAKKAQGANLRTQAKHGSAAAPLGSMEDTMKETLAAIRQGS